MLFIMGVLSIPCYIFFIWGLYEPEEAILFLDKWRYDEEPTFSTLQMKLFKLANIGGIVILTVLLLVAAFNPETLY